MFEGAISHSNFMGKTPSPIKGKGVEIFPLKKSAT